MGMITHIVRQRLHSHSVRPGLRTHVLKSTPAPIPGDPYYTNAIQPLESDVLFHLPLQETTGTTASDSSPAGNDGSYQDGPLLAQSVDPLPPYGLYVSLDGGTIEVPGIDLSGVSPWSVSIWCRFDPQSNAGTLWSLSDGTRDQEIRLYWRSANASLIFQREVIVTRSITYADIEPIQNNHIAITYDGLVATMYVNGVPVGSVSDANAIAAPTTPFIFNSGTVYGAVDGLLLSGVTLFDRALTPTEIANIYNAGVS